MNFLGHVRVALAVSDDPDVLLGAILPDLESLLGPVLDDGRDDPAVARGIAVHHRTDAAFHDDPRFRTGSIALTRALQARGVGRGASRGVGHAGWELLLDGVLADDRATIDGFAAAIEVLEARAPIRMAPFLDRQREAPIWLGYRDPAEVAARLHRQLSHRPRLAFPAEDLGVVTDELAAVQARIVEVAPVLVADITRAVTAEQSPPT